MRTKQEKGITLIALIITIILLVLLAAITINILLDSGIIKVASEGVQNYIDAGATEMDALDEAARYAETLASSHAIWDGETIEVPYIKEFNWYIYTGGQLKFLADFVNNNYTLTEELKEKVAEAGYNENDIVITEDTIIYLMNNINLGASWTEDGELVSGAEWTPIGKEKANTLIATFEGNGNTISGVYINSDTTFNGIFGNANTIKNLTIKGSYISGGSCTGGIVGALREGTLENCHNVNTTVIVKDGTYYTVGGICGQFTGTEINSCSNAGTIIAYGYSSSGYSYAGGIVGSFSATSATITNCTNEGTVTSEGNYTGGVVGLAYTSSTITSCTNTGTVTSEGSYTGGVAGYAYTSSTITSCKNEGAVASEGQDLGGIIGYAYITSISDCSNTADIKGDSKQVGGIAGNNYCGTLTQSVNSGNVSSLSTDGNIGGVVGKTIGGDVTNCYNYGNLVAYKRAGGIAGWAGAGTLSSCFNYGDVSGTYQQIGGVVGYLMGYDRLR